MPFILQDRRPLALSGKLLEWQPGDHCYVYYQHLVDQWKANPRWTTAHELYKELLNSKDYFLSEDQAVAAELAWQVFFIKYVMPYEDVKEKENGTI